MPETTRLDSAPLCPSSATVVCPGQTTISRPDVPESAQTRAPCGCRVGISAYQRPKSSAPFSPSSTIGLRRSLVVGLVAAPLLLLLFTATAHAQTGPRSCLDILLDGGATGDGVYTIDPDGPGAEPPVAVYCDMSTDGGGWTLVAATKDVALRDQASPYYADVATLEPAAGHQGMWDGMRPIAFGRSDIRFSCRNLAYSGPFDVDLAFYDIHWYDEITAFPADENVCFEEHNGDGQTLPPPARKNLLTGASRALGVQWSSGLFEGENYCDSNTEFTVDFDDRGIGGNPSDGTDWGEVNGDLKCGVSGVPGGTWFIWVRERSGLFVEPSTAAGFDLPGATLVYTHTVINLTGAADSFDLALSGNTWPAGLSTPNTGVVPDYGTATFTLQVAIPPGTPPGAVDRVAVTATSLNDPDLYQGTAAITTTALSVHRGYVFDGAEDAIRVLDTGIHLPLATIDVSAFANGLHRGALSPDGQQLYVGGSWSNSVVVVDTATHLPVTSFDVGSSPQGIVFSADGSRAFVANEYGDTVTVIDTAVPTVTATLAVGDQPKGVAGSPCLSKIYVTNFRDHTVSVIDVPTQAVTRTISGLDYPWDVVLSPFGERAYVTNAGRSRYDNPGRPSISVIDTATDNLIANWPLLGATWVGGLDISPDGSTLYVTDAQAGAIIVVDALTGAVIEWIPVGSGFTSFDFQLEIERFPAGLEPLAYVSVPWDDTVTVINTASSSVVETLSLPGEPRGMALFPPQSACLGGDVLLGPVKATAYAPAGATHVFTGTVYNLTGAADSFDLATAANTWPATLSVAHTGVIPHGAQASFTVTVEIPSGAAVGALDTVTVTATSAANPALYADTASLTSIVRAAHMGYAFNLDNDLIHVIDPELHTQVDMIDVAPYGGAPWDGALSPDGRWLVASLRDSSRALVISTTDYSDVTPIDVGTQPRGVAFSADGAVAFVTNRYDGTVSVVDTLRRVLTATIPVGQGPMDVARSPCLDKLYVTNHDGGSVSVIDVHTRSVIDTIPGFTAPRSIVISPFGHRVYATNRTGGTIGVIDTATDRLLATWNTPATRLSGLDVSPDGASLYAADRDNERTYVLDAGTGELLHTIPSGVDDTWEVELFPAGAGPFGYVTHGVDGFITILDTTTALADGTILLGGFVAGLALFPAETACLPGVHVGPPASGHAPVGKSVVFVETLFNLTGSADSFDVAVAGSTWPASLSTTNTGLVSHGAVVSFTVQVDIPPGTPVAAVGMVTVTATSASNPGVFSDAVTLEALATSDHLGYALNRAESVIHVLDTVPHTRVDDIEVGSFGDDLLEGELSPDGHWLFASLRDSGRVLVISTTDYAEVTPIDVGGQPRRIAFASDGSTAFVANAISDTVAVIDVPERLLVDAIPVGAGPVDVASSPCLDKLYVTNNNDGTVSVIDAHTRSVIGTISGFDNPESIVISPFGHRAYVSNLGDGSVGVIDTYFDALVATWPTPPSAVSGLDLSPDGEKLYLNDSTGGLIYVLDAANGQLLATIPIDNNTTWDVETFPAWAGPFAYVSNYHYGRILVLDTNTGTVLDTIPLGGNVAGLALFPDETSCPNTLLLEPGRERKFSNAGTTVRFGATLTNRTGMAGDFALGAAGNAWTTTLSLANTGPIADGAAITFTVGVDVPAGAPQGAFDVVTVTATSVSDPAVYSDTARLTTHVLRPGFLIDMGNAQIRILDTYLHVDTGRAVDAGPWDGEAFFGALSPDGKWLYAALTGADAVLVISATDYVSVTAISVGDSPHEIAFSSDGAYAFVTNRRDDTISVIDTHRRVVTATLAVDGRPTRIAASPCLDKLYVVTPSDDSVSVIDTRAFTVTAVIPGFGVARDVVIAPLGDRAYVSDEDGSRIRVIDTGTHTLIDTWIIGGPMLASLDISPDGRRLYVVDDFTGLTYVVETSGGQVVATILTDPMTDYAWDVEVFPWSAGPFAYFSTAYDGAVSVVDTTTDTVLRRLTLGGDARGLALFPPNTICGVPPTAAFTPTLGLVAVGVPVSFTNQTFAVPTATYRWDFGDATAPVTAENPAHTYTGPGSYTVLLTATNVLGTDAVTGTVRVLSSPLAAFSPTSSTIRPGDTVTFTNLSTGDPPLTYLWDFGDGSPLSTAESPAHTYSSVGSYIVLLTATNPDGYDSVTGTVDVVLAPLAAFSPAASTIRPGDTVTFTNLTVGDLPLDYLWDFGDGSPFSTAENPAHTYSSVGDYTVLLTATNPYGHDTVSGTVDVVLSPPLAAFAPTTSTIRPGDTVTFTNLTTGDPPLEYLWDFGDGSPRSSVGNPTHTYYVIGTFTVVLTATNPYARDSITGTVTTSPYNVYLPLLLRPSP